MFTDKRRGDVYWLNAPDPKPGSYLIGKSRPVLIVSSDRVNHSSQTIVVLPLTSSPKQLARGEGSHDRVQLDGYPGGPAMLLTQQIRTVDAHDLTDYCYTLTNADMLRVDNALFSALGL